MRTNMKVELKASVIIMTFMLRIQNFAAFKSAVPLVDSYSRWFVDALHECTVDLRDLLTICTACNRALIREHDKLIVTRAIVTELIQAIKFKCEFPEKNYASIVNLVLQDYGTELEEEIVDVDQFNTGASGCLAVPINYSNHMAITYISEAIRPFMNDILEFIADLHVLSKLKKQTNSDRIGGNLKAGLSEIVALEMSRP